MVEILDLIGPTVVCDKKTQNFIFPLKITVFQFSPNNHAWGILFSFFAYLQTRR